MKKRKFKNLINYFRGSRKNNSILLFLACILFVTAVGFVSLSIHYYSITKNLSLPEIITPSEITNDKITFESNKPFVAKINSKKHFADKIADDKFIVDIEENSGIYNYELYGHHKSKVFDILSKETSKGEILADYEEPEVSKIELKKMYNLPKEDFTISSNEEIIIEQNNKELQCQSTPASNILEYNCPLEFEKEGEINLNYSFKDTAGNITSQEISTIYTPSPEISCNVIPSITKESTIEVECTPNKEGLVTIEEKEFDINANSQNTFPINLVEEGENNINIVFTDTYDLKTEQNLKIIKDTTAPSAEFTFLDDKKEFQTGTIGIGFKTSENANIKVNFYPINNFFETDELAQQILNSGNFVYEGGQTFEQSIVAGEEVNLSTPNNFALCQILTANNKNCFSPGVVGIDINLTDELGNSRNYLCNNWLTSSTAQLDGLESTTCQEK